MEWAPPPTTPPPACRDDPWDLWNDAKAYLDRACRADKTATCGRILNYAKKKAGREFRTQEGVSIAAEVVAHLDLITKDDEDFLEAMARVIEYCGGRIGDRRLNADGLASITTSPDFARMMEYTCYRLMAMIRPENPKARYALEMIESQCRRHLDALPPETGDATTETPEEVDGGAGE